MTKFAYFEIWNIPIISGGIHKKLNLSLSLFGNLIDVIELKIRRVCFFVWTPYVIVSYWKYRSNHVYLKFTVLNETKFWGTWKLKGTQRSRPPFTSTAKVAPNINTNLLFNYYGILQNWPELFSDISVLIRNADDHPNFKINRIRNPSCSYSQWVNKWY